MALVSSWCIPISLLIFGWTARDSVHWYVWFFLVSSKLALRSMQGFKTNHDRASPSRRT